MKKKKYSQKYETKKKTKHMLNPCALFKKTRHERTEIVKQWYHQLNFSWKDPLSYFSMWTILFSILPFQTRIFQLMKSNMILQTSLGGFYMAYVRPKEIKIKYLNLIVDGWLLKLIDLVAHQSLLFLYLYGNGGTFLYPDNFFEYYAMNLPLLVYIFNFDMEEKYQFTSSDFFYLAPVYFIILFHPFFLY